MGSPTPPVFASNGGANTGQYVEISEMVQNSDIVTMEG